MKRSEIKEVLSSFAFILAFIATCAIAFGVLVAGCWGSVYIITSAVRAGWDQ